MIGFIVRQDPGGNWEVPLHPRLDVGKQRAQRQRLVDHDVMLSLGDLHVRRAGSDEAQKIGRMLRLKEAGTFAPRTIASGECALDERSRD
jgi:hypothetical protein